MAAPALLRDVATIILDCGLRPEECFRLRVEDIRDGAIHITYGKTERHVRAFPPPLSADPAHLSADQAILYSVCISYVYC